MLEVILEGRILYVLMGIVAAVGILSKIAVNLSLKRLVWAAGNMNKSNHPLMRLVKAKFEHACMVSDTVENVGVFVDKYLYEYRVLGMKLHTLRRLEKAAAAGKPSEKTGLHGKLEKAKEEVKAGNVLGKPQGKTRDTAMVM